MIALHSCCDSLFNRRRDMHNHLTCPHLPKQIKQSHHQLHSLPLFIFRQAKRHPIQFCPSVLLSISFYQFTTKWPQDVSQTNPYILQYIASFWDFSVQANQLHFIRIIIEFVDCQYMLPVQKKKRSNSGSRSKSRKCKNGEFSVDVRSRQLTEGNKILTENSSSLNKSKPSRKTSLKQPKKHNKSSNKDPKDPASHSISADRKHSLTKMNKTEVNYEGDDMEKQTFQVMMRLKHLKLPPCTNIHLIQEYFEELRECFEGVQDTLYNFCMDLHSYYMSPLKPLFETMEPYENHLKQREEIGRQIDQQVTLNEKLWAQMSPIDIEIFKKKEEIEEKRLLIEKLKQEKLDKLAKNTEEKKRDAKAFPLHPKLPEKEKVEHIGKGFKLDLEHINKEGQVGFHEQFYSKLDEFSESWRDQALRQKRF